MMLSGLLFGTLCVLTGTVQSSTFEIECAYNPELKEQLDVNEKKLEKVEELLTQLIAITTAGKDNSLNEKFDELKLITKAVEGKFQDLDSKIDVLIQLGSGALTATSPTTILDQELLNDPKIQGWINGGDLNYMTKEELILASSLANSGVITKLNYFIPMGVSLDGVDPVHLSSLIATATRAQLREVHFSVEQMAALARRSGQAGWRLNSISLWDAAIDTSTAAHWATVMSNTHQASSVRNILSNISQFYMDLKTSLGRAGSNCTSVRFNLSTLQTIQEEENEIDKIHAALGSWNGRPLEKFNNLIIDMKKN